MGTVNVMAMELGIPFDLVSAWKVIRAGKIRLIDEASANGHLFVQMAGIDQFLYQTVVASKSSECVVT